MESEHAWSDALKNAPPLDLDVVAELRAENAALHDRACKYERQLIEIGRSLGCNHHDDDFGLTRCVSDLAAERDAAVSRERELEAALRACVKELQDADAFMDRHYVEAVVHDGPGLFHPEPGDAYSYEMGTVVTAMRRTVAAAEKVLGEGGK